MGRLPLPRPLHLSFRFLTALEEGVEGMVAGRAGRGEVLLLVLRILTMGGFAPGETTDGGSGE